MVRKPLVGFLILLILPFWFLIRFLWTIFAKLVDFVGIKELRREGNKIQTPIVYFEHSITGKRVIFIGMTNVAEKEYFEKVLYLAKQWEREGYHILYEYVEKLVEPINEVEKELHSQLVAYRRLHEESAKILGVEYQKNWISRELAPPQWINNDTNELSLIEMFNSKGISFWKKAANAAKGLPETEKQKIRSRWLLNRFFAESAAAFLATKIYCFLFNAFHQKWDALKIILDYRNKIAMCGIKNSLQQADVVNIWGSAHLRGMEKILKKEGFEEVEKEWLTAYHIRDYSFWEALATFF